MVTLIDSISTVALKEECACVCVCVCACVGTYLRLKIKTEKFQLSSGLGVTVECAKECSLMEYCGNDYERMLQ